MPQTGATRYQKFLKSEKAKTKLKAKKDLPKGTNVTKTNFKVKKIVIKEQLKKHGETEALSTRKLNVKELLARLNHFNTQSRLDALSGLKELITAHPEVLDQNLGQLVHGVTPLVLNIEKLVRRDSLKVIHAILTSVKLEKIDPFFDIMSTYLRSAMTHIDGRIQEDSLLFLDVLLQCTPEKIAQNFHKIIPNFLDMISKLRVDSKPGRTLTVNLDSNITSVKWRVKVLHRLKDFLNKFVEYSNINSEDRQTVMENLQIFDKGKLNCYPLFNPNYIAVSHVSCFSSKNLQDNIELDEVEKFKKYIETLMTLMFETWLEVCPNMNKDKNIETVVSEDAAVLLKHTLEVVSMLWSLIKYLGTKNLNCNTENYFNQKYKSSFSQNFVHSFPYVTNIRSKQAKTNLPFEDVIEDPKLVAENLQICHLFILLNPNVNIKSNKQEINSVLNYIERIFNQNTKDDINEVIIKILNTVFSNEVTGWTKTLSITDALFRKIIWAYFNQNLEKTFKQQLFSLLCKIALNDKLGHYHSSDAYVKWLNNLPDILLEESVTVQTINIVHKFSIQNNKAFNTVIKPKLLKIINNLPSLKVTDSVNDTNSYHKLFSLLYWIKMWDSESLDLLEKQLIDGVYRSDHGKFIFDTLGLKVEAKIL